MLFWLFNISPFDGLIAQNKFVEYIEIHRKNLQKIRDRKSNYNLINRII